MRLNEKSLNQPSSQLQCRLSYYEIVNFVSVSSSFRLFFLAIVHLYVVVSRQELLLIISSFRGSGPC